MLALIRSWLSVCLARGRQIAFGAEVVRKGAAEGFGTGRGGVDCHSWSLIKSLSSGAMSTPTFVNASRSEAI